MADTYDDDEERLVIDDRLENSAAGAEMESDGATTAAATTAATAAATDSTVVEKEKKVLTNGNAASPKANNHVDGQEDGEISEERAPEKKKAATPQIPSVTLKRDRNDENDENGNDPVKQRKRRRKVSSSEETTSESTSPNEPCRDCALRKRKKTRDQETCVNTRSCQSEESLIELKEGMSVALNFTIVCKTGPNTYYIMTKLKGKSLYGVLTDGEPPLMVPTHNGSKRSNLCGGDTNGDFPLSNGGSAADIRSTASTPSKQRPGSKRSVANAVKLNFGGRGNRERSAGVGERPTSSCVVGGDEDDTQSVDTRVNSPVAWGDAPSASATELVEREDQNLKRCLYPSCHHRYESCDALHLHTASAHGPKKRPVFESSASQTSIRAGNGSKVAVATETDQEPKPEMVDQAVVTDPVPEKPCEKCAQRALEDAKREEKLKADAAAEQKPPDTSASTSAATPLRPSTLPQKTSPTVPSSPFSAVIPGANTTWPSQVIKAAESSVTPRPATSVAAAPRPQPSPSLSTTPKLPTGFPGNPFPHPFMAANPFVANAPAARLTPKEPSSSRNEAVTPKPQHKIHELGRIKKEDEKTASPSSMAKPNAQNSAFPSSSNQGQSSFMKPSTSAGIQLPPAFPSFPGGVPGMMMPGTPNSSIAAAYQQHQMQMLQQQQAMAMMAMASQMPHLGMGSPMRPPMMHMMMPDQQQLHQNAGGPGVHPAAMFAQQFKPN